MTNAAKIVAAIKRVIATRALGPARGFAGSLLSVLQAKAGLGVAQGQVVLRRWAVYRHQGAATAGGRCSSSFCPRAAVRRATEPIGAAKALAHLSVRTAHQKAWKVLLGTGEAVCAVRAAARAWEAVAAVSARLAGRVASSCQAAGCRRFGSSSS